MRSEALDITIEGRGSAIWLLLSGPFHNEQALPIREKIAGLIDDGCRKIVIIMESITDIGESVPQMFLSLVNIMRGKGGDIFFVFKNDHLSKAFAPYENIFSIYPDEQSLPVGGFFTNLKHRSKVLTRKTGIRLSRPIAITLMISLAGWILTLCFIIYQQNMRIRQQEMETRSLTEWQRNANAELKVLRERMLPLEQLGIIKNGK